MHLFGEVVQHKSAKGESSLRELKKIVKNAEDVFHLWKGISGHPHPSTDQHSSQPDAGFPVPGANNIAQHNEDIKAAEEKPRTVE